MNKVFLALFLALTISPVGALADTTNNDAMPAPPTQAQRQAMMQTMEQFHQQAERIHQQTRTEILNTLSTAHRAAIANIIGQLAISPNPDPRLAARQIDAMLSQGEQQRILSASTNERNQMKSLFEKLHQQMEAQNPNMPQHPNGMGPGGGWQHNGNAANRTKRAPDAGRDLLMMLSPHPMGMGHHGGGFPGGAPR
jgi:hypothetical protein